MNKSAQKPKKNLSAATSRVISLMLKMNPEEIFSLLEELEEKEREKQRRAAREKYFTDVDFAVGNRAFKGYINNISTEGIYIETKERFLVGTEITLTFILPADQGHIKAIGTIVRTDANGMGVAFDQDIRKMLTRRKKETEKIASSIKHLL
jgi:Tfp pilus assembly protein PilZ